MAAAPVRGLARVPEVAVRSALGATRGRVIAQLLTEHALLAVGGGVLGVIVAWAAVRGFVAFAPVGLPRLEEIGVNGSALAGALGITTAAMLLFAIARARRPATRRGSFSDVGWRSRPSASRPGYSARSPRIACSPPCSSNAVTLAGVAAVVLAVAALASLIPARSSTRIEPATALRTA